MVSATRPVGEHLRTWRRRRGLSQLEFSLEAEVSQRHLSFVESGRSAPSREMLLHLAERLDVPLRERNALLLAAGYAPVFPERPLDDPALAAAREAVERILKAHEPFPALAVDRHWTLVTANAAVAPLLAGVTDASLLQPPVNVLRLSLHPGGLAPRIANLPEWRAHLLDRLRHQISVSGDPVLTDLLNELVALPAPTAPAVTFGSEIVVPLELVTEHGRISLLSTTTIFGTPVEVTLSELAIESFFPADATTAEILRGLVKPGGDKPLNNP